MPDTALIIMARYPQEGQTKTRLGRAIGHRAAAELYRAFLADLAHRFKAQPYALHWAYTPAEVDYRAFINELVPDLPKPMYTFPQQGANLGARLLHAFQWTHSQGYSHIILIGSDTPQVTLANIENARRELAEADVVLGPAEDGGYYLIAMKQPHDVFSGIPMSTSSVTELTLQSARQQDLKTRLIESSFDIDELADLQRLTQLLVENNVLAPITAAHLAKSRVKETLQ